MGVYFIFYGTLFVRQVVASMGEGEGGREREGYVTLLQLRENSTLFFFVVVFLFSL